MSKIKSFNEYHNILESTFPRIIRTMRGDIESISTVGIMSAQNPLGRKESPEYEGKTKEEIIRLKKSYNEYANNNLKNELRDNNLGFHQVLGRYEANNEISLIIPNISRELMTQLGVKYGQESVIWGEKVEEGKFMFYFINCKTMKIDDVVEEVYFGRDVQSRDDFFTWVKGRKFVLPFFEEEPVEVEKERFFKPLIYQRHPKHRGMEFNMDEM